MEKYVYTKDELQSCLDMAASTYHLLKEVTEDLYSSLRNQKIDPDKVERKLYKLERFVATLKTFCKIPIEKSYNDAYNARVSFAEHRDVMKTLEWLEELDKHLFFGW